MPIGTLEKLAAKVSIALEELEVQLAPDQAVAYLGRLGTRFPDGLATDDDVRPLLEATSAAAGGLSSILADLVAAGDDAPAIIIAGGRLIDQVATLFGSLDDLIGGIDAKATAWAPLSEAEVHAFAANFPTRVLHDSLLSRIETDRPEIASAAVLLGLADRSPIPVVGADPSEPPAYARRLELGNLPAALSSPALYFKTLMHWGESPFDPTLMLERLQALLSLFTANTMIDTSSGSPVLVTAMMTAKANATVTPPGLDFNLDFGLPSGFTLSIPVGTGYGVDLSATGELENGVTLTLTPPAKLSIDAPVTVDVRSTLTRTAVPPETAIVLLGVTGATRIQVDAIRFSTGFALNSNGTSATGDVSMRAELVGGRAVVDFSDGDGLLSSLTGGKASEASFDAAVSYNFSEGLKFEAGANLRLNLPVHVSFAGVELQGLALSFPIGEPGRAGLPFDIATTIKGTFGPFTVVVEGAGLALDLVLGSGRLGVADVGAAFKFPTGIGVSIDSGGISGGGFLSRDPDTGRYAGAIELRVYAIGVKAFGVLDTRFPDGSEGMSFVVVIIAEFTPIQLSFGFTLNGVGGLLGVNRSVDTQALGDAVRTGSLAHLLFPVNVVANAPAIINDLATVFPATRDRQLFGPMGKLGWGTPTLITADIGIILEFPGPRLALVGVVRMQLPSAEFAILSLNLAIAGLLDFPAGKFSIDASLFDSYVAGYVVSGDMAFRMELGSKPKFLLSVGGFNSGFRAPARFPTLRRCSAELGINGNPSLTATGYFALTSNTAQFGAAMELRASGFGIKLRGGWALDVMFVFSPFSFTASISAGVRVDFHGFGLGITLHGRLSGPTPWHFNGRACVEVCIWDACLPIDIKFGRAEPAALPELDPWKGTDEILGIDPRISVRGLELAIKDPRNWAGETPPEGYSVVSLSAAATADRTPIDPVGSATLRQKVCPLNQELEKFGEYRPIVHTHFQLSTVSLGGQPVTEIELSEDDFAPAHFTNLSNAQRLSSDSFDKMIGGVRLAPTTVATGPTGSRTLAYETVFVTAEGVRVEENDLDPPYVPTQDQLRGMLQRSAAGRGGVRRVGAQKYMLAGRPKLFTLDAPTFLVVNACSMVKNTAITTSETTYTQASLALRNYEQLNPVDRNRFRVVPFYAAA